MNMLNRHRGAFVALAIIVLLAASGSIYYYYRHSSKNHVANPSQYADACSSQGYLFVEVHEGTSPGDIKKAVQAVDGVATEVITTNMTSFHIRVEPNQQEKTIGYFKKLPMTVNISPSSPNCIE